MTNQAIRNLLLILPLPLILAACEGSYSSFVKSGKDGCPKGGTYVNVHYGDSQLKVKPIAKVHRGGAFEFRLKPKKSKSDPDGVDYKEVNVTVKGKDVRSDWIEAISGTAKGKGKLVFCVKDSVALGRNYEYWVEVDQVGRLDPRADVEQ